MHDQASAENKPQKRASQSDSESAQDSVKLDRRALAGRIGKYLVYTAPALIALSTAKGGGNACSTCP